MGKDYLVEGAKLMCINGGEMKLLQVPIGHGYTSNFKKKANCGDCKACDNIPYFGSCAKNKETHTCEGYMLLADKWENISPGTNLPEMINGKEAITMDSVLLCKKGGLIVPLTSGQGYDEGVDMGAFLKRFQKIFMWVAGKNMLCQIFGKDPINMNTGNYIYEKEDLVIPGIKQLSFKLFYNAMEDGKGKNLGEGWHHNHEMRLKIEGRNHITICLEDGRQIPCRPAIGDTFVSIFGDKGLLKKVENGYCYCRNKGEDFFFNEHGLLTLKTDPNGFRETYSYNKENQLEKVSMENGSYLQYTYNKENNIIRVCDHTGREIRLWYRYGKLWKFINVMGNVYTYEYNENLKLESVITPRGIKGLLNKYDGVNRVVNQTLADGSVTEFRYDDTNFRTYMREQNGNMVIYESDERFRNTKTIYEDGEEVFEYNDNNQKTLYIDKNGNKTRYKYNEKGNLTGIENSLQHKTALTYDEHNHIIRYQYPDGSCIINEYDQEGNRVKTIDPCGNSTILGYNNHNQPESILQPDGGKILLGYDELGNIINILDAMGNKTVYAYDSLNRVVQVTDGNGNTKKYEYNNSNKIVKVINALGFEKTYDYSPSGKVTEVKHFDGSIQKMWYNLSNRPERYENQEGSSVAYEYDKMGNLVCEVMPNGGRRNLSYDKFNRLLQYEDVAGGKTMFAYDACGNCIKTINARGGVTHFSYDAINRVTKVIDPDMRETKYEYDLRGNVASITDQVGNRVSIEYDACGRKTKEKVGEQTVTVYSYNAIGKLKQITDGAGRETLYRYYPGGLLQAVEYSNGKTERYVYDSNRNVVEKWHNDEYGLFYSYDEENRIRTIRSSEGQVVSYDYDSVGNITCATDANGNKNKYDYSPLGRLKSVEDGKGNLTRYQYDAEGNLTCIFRTGTVEERHMDLEDAIRLNESQHNLHLTVYERNLSGQIIAITNPLGDQETFDYDVSGKLIAKTDRDGYKTSFTYSPSGMMESVIYDDGRKAEYEYNELSQLKKVKDWLGTIKAEYNQLGRVERVTDHRGKSVSYEFGSRGERKAIIYPDGSRIEYDYDNQLRLERVRNNKKTIKYQYGKYGRMEERSCSNGLNTSYRYDYAGRLTELIHKKYDEVLEDYRYTYDKMDNKSGIKKYRKGIPEESGVYRYYYDDVGNLSIVEKDGKQVRGYDYDTFSNRIVKMNGQEITEYQFNAADQMIMETGRDVCRYNYDKRGNLNEIDKAGIVEKTYKFDAAGRMGAAETLSGAGRQYIYNGLGKRVSILEQQDGVCSSQMEYILDMTLEYNNLLASENGMKTQKYLWGNQLEGMEENGQDSFALLDEMGSPVRFLWGNGNDMCYYGYDEFGCDLYGNAGEKQPFGYTGYLPDSISGSYFAQAREYLPEGGRFFSEDIQAGYLKNSLSLNKYLYCWNDPLKFVDHNGKSPMPIYPPGVKPDTPISDLLNSGAQLPIGADREALEEIAKQEQKNKKFMEENKDTLSDDYIPNTRIEAVKPHLTWEKPTGNELSLTKEKKVFDITVETGLGFYAETKIDGILGVSAGGKYFYEFSNQGLQFTTQGFDIGASLDAIILHINGGYQNIQNSFFDLKPEKGFYYEDDLAFLRKEDGEYHLDIGVALYFIAGVGADIDINLSYGAKLLEEIFNDTFGNSAAVCNE